MSRSYADTLDDQLMFARVAEGALRRDRLSGWRDEDIERIKDSDSYFLTAGFLDLVEAAMESLPEGSEVVREDFPATSGWFTFERSLIGEKRDIGISETVIETNPLVGLWWDLEALRNHAMLWMWEEGFGIGGYFVHLSNIPIDDPFWPTEDREQFPGTWDEAWDKLLGEKCPCKKVIGDGQNYWDRWFKALWLLLSQRNVTDVSEESLPRAARRRAEHECSHSTVRVVRLPRRASHGDGTRDVDWHHRWIVRGHWRQQPWGPERKRVRPVWIAPYVKGPEDAPMLDVAHRLFVAEAGGVQ